MFRTIRAAPPEAWTSYPGITPAINTDSVYNQNQTLYPFDVPNMSSKSRANGDWVAQKARIGQERKCMFSCNNPPQIDLIAAVANGNQGRYP